MDSRLGTCQARPSASHHRGTPGPLGARLATRDGGWRWSRPSSLACCFGFWRPEQPTYRFPLSASACTPKHDPKKSWSFPFLARSKQLQAAPCFICSFNVYGGSSFGQQLRAAPSRQKKKKNTLVPKFERRGAAAAVRWSRHTAPGGLSAGGHRRGTAPGPPAGALHAAATVRGPHGPARRRPARLRRGDIIQGRHRRAARLVQVCVACCHARR